ncbi:unnamed protein product [Macrosiphum euphorbiae]|uniref:Uncharacterized protein n=1 Tax=Macrosiphum euphorbiae TaxID=13131 RepID=A0AAV0WZB4_9HEMI|nr:unnamed protein product [Macrosiphum euphorbiae]
MKVNDHSFTALSMLSEQHDNVSIALWLKRWLQCNIKPPKISVSDQSIALMSATVQAFTQYNSLEKYLKACFSIVHGGKNVEIPLCYIRNDINHFIHLVTQWKPLKLSKFKRTKQLFGRAMGLLVYCRSIEDANPILEAIFVIALSKYDGAIVSNTKRIVAKRDTPCAKSKKYLQSLISTSQNIVLFDDETEEQHFEGDDSLETDLQNFDLSNSFRDWAKSVSTKCEAQISGIEGEFDNAQYTPDIVPLIINIMKLFPCWSSIMLNVFGYGEDIATSSRSESNFNNIKTRVFNNENMPVRIDDFVGKLVDYYRGDQLIIQTTNHETTQEIISEDNRSFTLSSSNDK